MAGPAAPKKGVSMTRWRVSDRGHVAHIRVGAALNTLCGESLSATAKPVRPNAMNPSCVKCDIALYGRAAVEEDEDE